MYIYEFVSDLCAHVEAFSTLDKAKAKTAQFVEEWCGRYAIPDSDKREWLADVLGMCEGNADDDLPLGGLMWDFAPVAVVSKIRVQ